MRGRKAEFMDVDEDWFSADPAWIDWDNAVTSQHWAVAACQDAGDRLGEARARNALGLLGLRRGYHSSARFEFDESLRILSELGDDRWTPVVRMHVAECMAGVGSYRKAGEVLAESLAVFRERGDAGREAAALRLLGVIQRELERRPKLTTSSPGIGVMRGSP
jgi:hypothetical protein